MFNRYFAIRNTDGFFRGHMIVSPSQISNVLYHNADAEVFTAIELYSGKEVFGSPICFDIDFEDNIEMALATSRKISKSLCDIGIKHNTYFSGSKGFHIVIPTIVLGHDSHLLIKAIKKTSFDLDGVDEHIYRERSLFRCEGSINLKTKLYKTKVNILDSLDDIKSISSTKKEVVLSECYINNNNIRPLINKALPAYKAMKYSATKERVIDAIFDAPICIRKMWEDKDPPRHIWHNIIYTIAKSMLLSGMHTDDIIDAFDSHDFWGSISSSGYNRRSYTKVILSLARTEKTSIGCNSGLSSHSMKHYCSMLCPIINKDLWGLYEKGKGKEKEDNSN